MEALKDPVVDELNKKMINRCANVLSRDQEFSAPEVVSYLMGWGDRYVSHHFVTIYWDSVIYNLKENYPELRDKSHREKIHTNHAQHERQDIDEDSVTTMRPKQGHIELRNQKDEYKLRPQEMEEFNYWDYFLDIYEMTHRHETLSQFVGKWFPRREDSDNQDLYCTSMLMLFKPWRQLADLKMQDESFKAAFDKFIASCPQRFLRVMDNMEYYYMSVSVLQGEDSDEEDQMCDTDLREEITDEVLMDAKRSNYTNTDECFVTRAMFFALNAGIFDESEALNVDWPNVN
ncbi:hypothetical protein BDN71DRAFT_1508086 [Pleurotus eryngii]|uniref:Uncharacterized protein n=1 Tax=Pleurotus eryngii TaxID=5323 RepID=A0A9P6DEG7_PLEER|nr:hypothetical protein BDN71DRAFT_1508086 [Pleurotus eryngii]